MRYGYIGYVQLTKDGKLDKERVIKKAKPDPEVKLSKQIKTLMQTALFNTNASLWRLAHKPPMATMQNLPPLKPPGIKQAPTLLSSRLSEIFYTTNADWILKNFDKMSPRNFRQLGESCRRHGASWQPVYDLVSDDPNVHIELMQKLLQHLDFPVEKSYSTVFCFAFVQLASYKTFVAKCPALLRPYVCLCPANLKEHEAALAWAKKRPGIRVALNADLFLTGKKPDMKPLKLAYRDIKQTWAHNVGSSPFTPLALITMHKLDFLPTIAKSCNVVITDFQPFKRAEKKRVD